MRDLSQYEVLNPAFTTQQVEELEPNHAVIEVTPLMNGYGHTLGNASSCCKYICIRTDHTSRSKRIIRKNYRITEI